MKFVAEQPPSAQAGLFGRNDPPEHAEMVLIGVPWEATATYGRGASRTPEALVSVSHQLDFFDPLLGGELGGRIAMLPVNPAWRALNQRAVQWVDQEIRGAGRRDRPREQTLAQINRASEQINRQLYQTAADLLGAGKIAAVLGGDHSCPLGLMRAVFEKHPGAGVLHIDAHHDLRPAYEGLIYSHASIMYNLLTGVQGLDRLVSVGIRDFSQEEYDFAQNHPKVTTFYDRDIKTRLFEGDSWSDVCEEILELLPECVYLSIDIDGLNPSLCPHTGTPVPGGLDFTQLDYLLDKLVRRRKRILGFDLCEVAPNPDSQHDEWDLNVGARVLYRLCVSTHLSQGEKPR